MKTIKQFIPLIFLALLINALIDLFFLWSAVAYLGPVDDLTDIIYAAYAFVAFVLFWTLYFLYQEYKTIKNQKL